MNIRIATRGSALARTQAGMVAAALEEQGHDVELVTIVTTGDTNSAPLALVGGHGVFVGAVRAAVVSGDCDIAVHSLKDVPVDPHPDLLLVAVPAREDPADVVCSRHAGGLDGLPPGALVGTGSPRRAAQVLAYRSDLAVRTIRGNVDTRLGRLDRDLDAVVLAMAGLARLGRTHDGASRLDPDQFLPAPGQGALAIECRADASPELRSALAPLNHAQTHFAVTLERQVLARLDAGCTAPVGALATVEDGRVRLVAEVLSDSGAVRVRAEGEAGVAEAVGLGVAVAEVLLERGAEQIIAQRSDHSGSLKGRRILMPRRAPDGLAAALSAAGADVTRASLTRIQPLPLEEYEQALVDPWDWVVVTSPQTVKVLVEAGLSVAVGVKIAAAGPATAAALNSAGLHADLVADPGGGAAVASAMPPGPGRVLFPGALRPSDEPAAGLTAKGWSVRHIAVYETVPDTIPAEVVAQWTEFDAFIVTAGSVARAVVDVTGVPGPPVIAIGEATAKAVTDLGLRVIGTAVTPDATGLFAAAVDALAPRPDV